MNTALTGFGFFHPLLTTRAATAPLLCLLLLVPTTAAMRPTIEHVRQAAARLNAVGAPPTPILRSEWIDKMVGCKVAFKAEHLQRTGSFKYRGATNAVGALDDEAAAKGVVAHSSGNHGVRISFWGSTTTNVCGGAPSCPRQ